MNITTRNTTLAVSFGTLAWLVPHAVENGSFQQPTTYIGIAVGMLIVGAAWLVGRRRGAKDQA